MHDIDKIADRPRAYLAGSGVLPLTSGLVFFTLGIFALVQSRLMLSPEYRIYGLVAQYAGLCCTAAVFWGIAVIKRRIVFPRGGYVQLSQPGLRLWVTVPFFMIAAGLPLILFVWPDARSLLEGRLLAPAFSSLFAVTCLVDFWKERRSEMLAFGLYLLLLAPILWWIPGNGYERLSALAVAVGPPMAIAGAVRLRRFLKANPLDVGTANGRR